MRTAPLSDDLCPFTGITDNRTTFKGGNAMWGLCGAVTKEVIFPRNTKAQAPTPADLPRQEGKSGAKKRKAGAKKRKAG